MITRVNSLIGIHSGTSKYKIYGEKNIDKTLNNSIGLHMYVEIIKSFSAMAQSLFMTSPMRTALLRLVKDRNNRQYINLY